MKVAIIHDWLTGMRGGESVLEAIVELFDKPHIFTLIDFPDKISSRLASLPTTTSWMQRLPDVEKRYRQFLPLMPAAVAGFDLRDYDLVISSSHCVAKGARKAPPAVHVSYVHAPMRYMWARFDEYFGPGRATLHIRLAARFFRPFLRSWDRAVSGSDRVNVLIANSHYIAGQIREAYGREAKVIHPFADAARFGRPRRPSARYLIVGAFAPYKRVDLAIEAFNRLRLPLAIVGSGQDEERLRKIAGPTVEFLGARSNDDVADLYSTCRAFIFPGAEDFGITPLEAMAAGAPVIAYGVGGALETVTPKTGLFFLPQTVDSIAAAIRKFEAGDVPVSEADCRARAAEFSRERFQREIATVIRETWASAGKDPRELAAAMRRKD